MNPHIELVKRYLEDNGAVGTKELRDNRDSAEVADADAAEATFAAVEAVFAASEAVFVASAAASAAAAGNARVAAHWVEKYEALINETL